MHYRETLLADWDNLNTRNRLDLMWHSLIAVIAGYLPARRATRVDPLVALRYE